MALVVLSCDFQERCQVFSAIAYAAVDNELAAAKTELTRKLLELLLQGCIMDLKESGKLFCFQPTLSPILKHILSLDYIDFPSFWDIFWLICKVCLILL